MGCSLRQYMVFALLALTAVAVVAEPVTPEMAVKAAEAWLRENPGAGRDDNVDTALRPRPELDSEGTVL